MNFKRIKFISFMGLLFTCLVVAAEPLKLISHKQSNYVIVLDHNAIPSEQTAAHELQYYLTRISGVVLPIQHAAPNSGPAIYVGCGTELAARLPNLDLTKLRPDEIIIKSTRSGDIVLSGNRPRGTLYAVYAFLEQELGVRWWSSQAEYVPAVDTVVLRDLNIRYAPPFAWREAYYADVIRNPVFAARMKNNGVRDTVSVEYGGHDLLWGDTVDFWVPASEYRTSHPEWFSGNASDGQPCLTNAAFRTQLVENIRLALRDHPAIHTIAIIQNDNQNYCRCTGCVAQMAKLGNPSDLLIEFMNRVADELAKEFPEITIETLAYQYTRPAPLSVKPSSRVRVRVCSIEADFARPLNSAANAGVDRDLQAWSVITTQLAVWNYVANFTNYAIPHPNLTALATDLRYFARHGVKSAFEQGDVGSGQAGDFAAMRVWVLSHLMWDPSLNEDAVIKEFLAGYYGAAAPYLTQYLDLLARSMAEYPTVKLTTYMPDTAAWLPYSRLCDAKKILASAQAAVAGDAPRSHRVALVQAGLDWALLWRMESSFWGVVNTPAAKPDKTALAYLLKQTVAVLASEATATGGGCLGEGMSSEQCINNLRLRLGLDVRVDLGKWPDFMARLPASDVIKLMPEQYSIINWGHARKVEDTKAVGGWAWQLRTDSTVWAVQFPLPAINETGHRWELWVELRTPNDFTPDLMVARAGVFSWVSGHDAGVEIPAGKISGTQYRFVSLGSFEFNQNSLVYVAGVKTNPSGEIRVNRMVLTRRTSPTSVCTQ